MQTFLMRIAESRFKNKKSKKKIATLIGKTEEKKRNFFFFFVDRTITLEGVIGDRI